MAFMAKKKIKYQGISTLEVLEEAKNYNNWIAHEIATHVTPPTLEIGAGIGNLSKYFLSYTPLYLSDKDKALANSLKMRFAKNKHVIVEQMDISKKPKIKYRNFFSTIYAINVLEHIEDDDQALRNMRELLKKKGKVLLLVPAKKRAYTRLDKELGHFRRYEKHELTAKLNKNGFAIEELYFFNIVGLLSWTVRDRVSRNKKALKSYQIKIFDSIVPILRYIESFIRIPVGISLIVVARKV